MSGELTQFESRIDKECIFVILSGEGLEVCFAGYVVMDSADFVYDEWREDTGSDKGNALVSERRV